MIEARRQEVASRWVWRQWGVGQEVNMERVLTTPQRRALRAAARGEVKRYYDGNSDVLTAPFSGAAALKAKSIIA
jgi:hypothetical protein